MANTEKPMTKQEAKKQVVDIPKIKEKSAHQTPSQKKGGSQLTTKKSEPIGEAKVSEEKPSEEKPKEEKKKPIQKKPVVKKTEVFVNGKSLPISAKYSIAICRFIKNKKIEKAITDLEQVLVYKKSIPMKGEIPHRKGKGMMSGRYPQKATEHFIKLLKNLLANANAHEVENPIIAEVITNLGSRPYGRFGRVKRKRTHVKIIAKEKKTINKDKKEKKK